MFRKYGVAGILLILFVEINFFLKIQPFANFYFPIVWFGYILTIDALVNKLRGESLISDHPDRFFGMVIISALSWWIFEFLNIFTGNWNYTGTESMRLRGIMGTLSFSTVMPAFFETVELIRSVHLFEKRKLHGKHRITKGFLRFVTVLGVAFFIAPFAFPKFAYPLIWLSIFLILDPINYLHRQPSVVGHLKDGKLAVPLSLLLAGISMGFLWEFWNYWAVPRWTYDVPFVGFFKIFEMPALGYIGYFPFALELYSMYWFARSLFTRKEGLLE